MLNLGFLALFIAGVVFGYILESTIGITWPVLQYVYSIVFLIALIRIRQTVKNFDEVALNQCYLAMHYTGVLLINITGTVFSVADLMFF